MSDKKNSLLTPDNPVFLIGIVLVSVLVGVILSNLLDLNFIKIADNRQASTIAYSDLVSVLLTAVTVLVTIFGVGIALFAFIGINNLTDNIKRTTSEIANETAKQSVQESLKDGGDLHKLAQDALKPGGPLAETLVQFAYRSYLKDIGLEESSDTDNGDQQVVDEELDA